jgi:hypothetical protein
MTLQDFENRKTIRYESLKEFITMLSVAPQSLKTELTGEELAKEIIKGALFLKRFIENGEAVLSLPDQ